MKVKSVSRVWLYCDPMDCSLPDSSVHGIFQARVLEWFAISFSRGSSQPRDWTQVCRIAGKHFTIWASMVSYFICLWVQLISGFFPSSGSYVNLQTRISTAAQVERKKLDSLTVLQEEPFICKMSGLRLKLLSPRDKLHSHHIPQAIFRDKPWLGWGGTS